ncbi:MarR family winged helix-turn-helix transcriptional regulator [uncultured Sphingomonas sp.]|mgnify:FL=1|uniref:MarR family winged helix-turn-helix transcriptional regulator n=1 Tax=uncultured Sphingomonas sp. TaxID=158754 RepID=UPI00261EEA41|nr:MarR family transcriptional regulator [uncultured Sphingomonas sp.]
MTETFGFLLSDTSRLLRRRFDERARSLGATRAQWKALLSISRREGINQGSLADILEVEPITLCRLIDRIEEAGLVERRRDPNDRRAWQLFLTDKAHPILAELHDTGAELSAQALRGIPEDSIIQLTDVLNRIRENLAELPQPEKDSAHG